MNRTTYPRTPECRPARLAGFVLCSASAYSESVASPRAPDHVLIHLRRARDHADRHFAEPLDLGQLASIAALSKFHFHRLFVATYGRTPARHVSERRIERAQDLLRSTNLTVTEVCFAVGFNSLGSFSSRFAQIVGQSPSAYQRRYRGDGPRIPGCYLFMSGYIEQIARQEKQPSQVEP
jgi:transcriptional regulator GlxA family with amidase domain